MPTPSNDMEDVKMKWDNEVTNDWKHDGVIVTRDDILEQNLLNFTLQMLICLLAYMANKRGKKNTPPKDFSNMNNLILY